METRTRLLRLEQNSKRYKGRAEDLDVIFREIQTIECIKRNVNITQLIMAVELSEPSAVGLVKEVLL